MVLIAAEVNSKIVAQLFDFLSYEPVVLARTRFAANSSWNSSRRACTLASSGAAVTSLSFRNLTITALSDADIWMPSLRHILISSMNNSVSISWRVSKALFLAAITISSNNLTVRNTRYGEGISRYKAYPTSVNVYRFKHQQHLTLGQHPSQNKHRELSVTDSINNLRNTSHSVSSYSICAHKRIVKRLQPFGVKYIYY